MLDEIDVRRAFEKLTSLKEWCSIFTPPQVEEVRTRFRGQERVGHVRKNYFIAINHPEPWYELYEAEICDREGNRTYFIDNKTKIVRVREGIYENIHTDKSAERFVFRGRVEDIVEEFRRASYEFKPFEFQ